MKLNSLGRYKGKYVEISLGKGQKVSGWVSKVGPVHRGKSWDGPTEMRLVSFSWGRTVLVMKDHNIREVTPPKGEERP